MRATEPDTQGEAPLSCAEVAQLLNAWVDGEFDAAEGGRIEDHLAACVSCARIARLQSQFKLALRRSAGRTLAAPLTLREAVLARLDEAETDSGVDGELERDLRELKPSPAGPWARLLQQLTPRRVAFAAATAGIAAWLLAGGLSHPLLQRDDRGVLAQRHAALDDGIALHARTLPLDFAATDAGSVQRWLQGRLDFGVRLPSFQRENPLALQGVRLSTLHAHPAAVVSYTVQAGHGGRVSLVIVDDPQEQLPGVARQVSGREVWLSQARGYNVASWRANEVVYSLISDLDEPEVLALVQAAELH